MRCTTEAMEPPDDVTLRSHEDNPRFRRDPTIESLTDSCITVVEANLTDYEDDSSSDTNTSDCSAVSYEDHTLTSVPRHALERRELLPTPDYQDYEDNESSTSYTSYTSDSQSSEPGLYEKSSDNIPETCDEWSDLDGGQAATSSSCSLYGCLAVNGSSSDRTDSNISAKSTTLGSEDSGFDERQQELWKHLNSCPHVNSSPQLHNETNDHVHHRDVSPEPSYHPHHQHHHHHHYPHQEATHVAPPASYQSDSDRKSNGNAITDFIARFSSKLYN